jgi:ferrochelatase
VTNFFSVRNSYDHNTKHRVGILISNLGTPQAPTASALKPYLRQFLMDKRVIEVFRPVWYFILNAFILTRRPKKSAEAYASIWTDEGSPLLVISKSQEQKLRLRLQHKFGDSVAVSLGMRYGRPSIGDALHELKEQEVTKLIMLPLYAQYSSATAGSTFDAVTSELQRWRWVPELRTIMSFHDHQGYVNSLVKSIQTHWQSNVRAEKLVFSYHGIPMRYMKNGDPYHCHCLKTSRLVAEKLNLAEADYIVSFQSLFGKEEWIKPYTSSTLKYLAKSGIKSVDVICPGFIADCVETLEEIEEENRHYFIESGGESFSYIPALNDRDDFIEFLVDLVEEHSKPWLPEASSETAQKYYEAYESKKLRLCPYFNK